MNDSQHQLIVLGEISGHYGIKGWVKIKSFTRPREQILDYKAWHLSNVGASGFRNKVSQSAQLQMTLKQGRIQGKSLVAFLDGVNSREDAEHLIGRQIMVSELDFAKLEDGEYYWTDLIGLEVSNLAGVALGTVDHLLETGANDVLVLKYLNEQGTAAERLIPWTGDTVHEVSLEKGTMRVDWDPEF